MAKPLAFLCNWNTELIPYSNLMKCNFTFHQIGLNYIFELMQLIFLHIFYP